MLFLMLLSRSVCSGCVRSARPPVVVGRPRGQRQRRAQESRNPPTHPRPTVSAPYLPRISPVSRTCIWRISRSRTSWRWRRRLCSSPSASRRAYPPAYPPLPTYNHPNTPFSLAARFSCRVAPSRHHPSPLTHTHPTLTYSRIRPPCPPRPPDTPDTQIGYGSPQTLSDTGLKLAKGVRGDAPTLRPTFMVFAPTARGPPAPRTH